MHTEPPVGTHDEVLDLPQVAAALGASESTLRYWRQTGDGPKSFKIGRRIRYLRSDLDAFIKECRGDGGESK